MSLKPNRMNELTESISALQHHITKLEKQIACGVTGHSWRFNTVGPRTAQPNCAICSTTLFARFHCNLCGFFLQHSVSGLPDEFRKLMDGRINPPDITAIEYGPGEAI